MVVLEADTSLIGLGHLNGHCSFVHAMAVGHLFLQEIFPGKAMEAVLTEVIPVLIGTLM